LICFKSFFAWFRISRAFLNDFLHLARRFLCLLDLFGVALGQILHYPRVSARDQFDGAAILRRVVDAVIANGTTTAREQPSASWSQSIARMTTVTVACSTRNPPAHRTTASARRSNAASLRADSAANRRQIHRSTENSNCTLLTIE
jgi:hypothetical protein